MTGTLGSYALFALLTVFCLQPAAASADSMNEEIDHLINSVGEDGCTFIRNGKRLSTRTARAHLRSKRRRNAHIVDSTEEFIEKIASESVTSGKPYVIRCKGEPRQNARDWFKALLDERRESS